MELNAEDGGNRRFILVQLPEKTDKPDYPTIAHITRERVRRAGAKVREKFEASLKTPSLPLEEAKTAPDTGFKAFRLAASNFLVWDGDTAAQGENVEALSAQLSAFADNVKPDATPDGLLFELFLKSGLPLDAKRETRTIAGITVHLIGDNELLLCLEDNLTQDALRGMAALKPNTVLLLDKAFHGNDALLTNAELEFDSAGVAFVTV